MVYIMLLCGMWLMNNVIFCMEQVYPGLDVSCHNQIIGEQFFDYDTEDEEEWSSLNNKLNFLNENSNLCSHVHNFINLYELRSITKFTPKNIIQWLEDTKLHTFAENIGLVTATNIKKYKESFKITKMLTQQEYLYRIQYVIDQTPTLIKELRYCDELPLGSYYQKPPSVNEKKVLLLKAIWYTYCMHLIPNMQIYQDKKMYMTYPIMDQNSLSSMIDRLEKRRKLFLHVFLHPNYLSKIQDSIVPDLASLIGYQNKKNKPTSHLQSILMALNRLITFNNVNKKTKPIDLKEQEKLNICWQSFWTEAYNQALNQTLLSRSQYLTLPCVNDFVKAVDTQVLINNQNLINTDISSDDDVSTSEEILVSNTTNACDPTEKSCFYSWFFAANLGGVADKQKKE